MHLGIQEKDKTSNRNNMSIFVIQEKKLIAPGTSLFQKNLALVACHREKAKKYISEY